MDPEDSAPPSFSAPRRWGIGFHVVLSALAVFAIAAMLNYLAHRHNYRFYVSKSSTQKLTPLTLQVLKSLTNTVKVTVFFNRHDALFNSVSALIKEDGAHSRKLEIEFVDYRMPGRAEAIRNQYKLTSGSDGSRIIFDENGHVRTVLGSELSDYDIAASMQAARKDKEILRTGFRGEQMFTSALLNLSQVKPATAYFLQGHGEHNPSDDGDQGYSLFARLLRNNNVEVKILPPLLGIDIPTDCSLLIIPGPNALLDTEEISKIERYQSQGGRMFVLFGYGSIERETGLERLLLKANIEVGFNRVEDLAQSQGGDKNVIVTSQFGSHPIMKPLMRSSLKLILPRSISQRMVPVTAADAPKIVELATTSTGGRTIVRTEGNLGRIQRQGAIPMLVAWEKEPSAA